MLPDHAAVAAPDHAERPCRVSAACLAGLLGGGGDLGGALSLGSTSRPWRGPVPLLVAVAVRNDARRGAAEPPRWPGAEATPARARARRALLVLGVPSDLLVMLAVGLLPGALRAPGPRAPCPSRPRHRRTPRLVLYTLLRPWVRTAMPDVRGRLTPHGWLVLVPCGPG